MRKKLGVGAAGLLLLLLSTAAIGSRSHTAPQANYVASRERLPFHRPDCKWAGKIAARNLQTFETREDAIAAGHRPCKVCSP